MHKHLHTKTKSNRADKQRAHQPNENGLTPEAPNDHSSDETYLVDLRRVTKEYVTPAGKFRAINEIDLQITDGEFVAIVGKSGSGKSTLLNLITGIDSPTTGEVHVAGTEVHHLSQNQSAIWRGNNVGMVFQFFQLLPTLSIRDNIMLPMDFCSRYSVKERKERAMHLLERVDIAEQAHKLPAMLSGGQQQRAAIARSMANDPPVIVADEPTGNLDSHTADAMLTLFQQLADMGKTVLMVTHERNVSQWVSRTVTLADGEIVGDSLITDRATSLRAQEIMGEDVRDDKAADGMPATTKEAAHEQATLA